MTGRSPALVDCSAPVRLGLCNPLLDSAGMGTPASSASRNGARSSQPVPRWLRAAAVSARGRQSPRGRWPVPARAGHPLPGAGGRRRSRSSRQGRLRSGDRRWSFAPGRVVRSGLATVLARVKATVLATPRIGLTWRTSQVTNARAAGAWPLQGRLRGSRLQRSVTDAPPVVADAYGAMSSAPSKSVGVLVLLASGLPRGAEHLVVPPYATTILGWARPPSVRAPRITSAGCPRDELLDDDHVLPVIAEVVRVREPVARSGCHVAQSDGSLVSEPELAA